MSSRCLNHDSATCFGMSILCAKYPRRPRRMAFERAVLAERVALPHDRTPTGMARRVASERAR